MSLQGKQSPNSINLLASLIQSIGLHINSDVTAYAGTSTDNATYTPGTLVNSTVLSKLSSTYNLVYAAATAKLSNANKAAFFALGSASIPALGNSNPSTYTGTWGYNQAVSQWGFARMPALQAYTEFNTGSYSGFCGSFISAYGFKSANNPVISSLYNAPDYLKGVYSNMNDLITADITGVNQSTVYWGQDLIKSGRAINLATIKDFGLPSNLLKTLQANNALTEPVNIALVYA